MTSIVKARSHYWSVDIWVSILLAATMFAMPLSSTAKSVLVPVALSLILLTPAYRQSLIASLNQPWCQAAGGLFFIALIACMWSSAHVNEKLLILEKYSKLLYLPILAAGFTDGRTRKAGISAFLAAMAVTCIGSILKACALLDYNGADPGNVFRNHIIAGHMIAFAAYLSAWLLIHQPGRSRILYACLLFLFTYQTLFLNTGRTGYVVYLLLMVVLMVQTLSLKKAIFATLIGGLLFLGSFYESTTMQVRLHDAVHDWQHYHHSDDKNTPIGYRLQFHEFAKNLYYRHPWFGNGTGSFTHIYQEENPVPSWSRRLLEPHSQYWLTAVEFGNLGLLALFLFFGSLLVCGLKLQGMRPVAIALLLPFFVGNLSDSLLFYSGSGYFFLLFMAMCLGEQAELRHRAS